MKIIDVYLPKKLRAYLEKRGLASQYDKQIFKIVAGKYKQVDLAYRKPKKL